MGKIALEGLEFFAYHGFYKSERQTGNKFRVDVEVTVDFSPAAASDKLNQTVNYEELYKIVKAAMATPCHLLEHLGEKICTQVLQSFPSVTHTKLAIRKFNPPIGGICLSACVTLEKSASDLQ